MSEQKHTPGPWEFSCEENNGWKGHTFSVQINAGETLIASYDTSYVEYPETNATNEANARLIAASPRMLEALIRMCQVFPTDIDMVEAGWNPREVEDACTAHDEARAAIAAATGVSQP